MNTSNDRAVYGKALGTTLLGLAGLAAQGLITPEARAESAPIRVFTSESIHKDKFELKLAFAESPLGVLVSAADLDGDGHADVVVGSPPGLPEELRVLSGATGKHITSAELSTNTNGGRYSFIKLRGFESDPAFVSAAVKGPVRGGWDVKKNQKVRVDYMKFSTLDSGELFAGQDLNGGLYVATGDVDGDGHDDIAFGSPGAKSQPGQVPPPSEVHIGTQDVDSVSLNFTKIKFDYAPLRPFGDGYSGGVRVAVGDVDGDGVAEVASVGNMGNHAEVSFHSYDKSSPVIFKFLSSHSFDNTDGGDVDVAIGDLNGDGRAEMVASYHKDHKGEIEILSWSFGAGSTGAEGNVPPSIVWSVTQTLSVFGPGSTYDGGFNLALADVTGDGLLDIIAAPASVVPEPTSVSLMMASAVSLRRRRRRID